LYIHPGVSQAFPNVMPILCLVCEHAKPNRPFVARRIPHADICVETRPRQVE
jgi:hypothetical protein